MHAGVAQIRLPARAWLKPPIYVHDILNVEEKPVEGNATRGHKNARGIVGRYLLQPYIFEVLESLNRTGNQSNLELTSGIADLLNLGKPVFGYPIKGVRNDIGRNVDQLQGLDL